MGTTICKTDYGSLFQFYIETSKKSSIFKGFKNMLNKNSFWIDNLISRKFFLL